MQINPKAYKKKICTHLVSQAHKPHVQAPWQQGGPYKPNKCNHYDLNWKQSKPDVQKRPLGFSFDFHRFISYPSHCLIWHFSKLWSHCNLILFLCHNSLPPYTLPFKCIFHHLVLSRLLFDPLVRYAPRPNSQSPCFYDGGVFVKQRVAPELQKADLSLSLLSAPCLPRHTPWRFFISEYQCHQGYGPGRPWKD